LQLSLILGHAWPSKANFHRRNVEKYAKRTCMFGQTHATVQGALLYTEFVYVVKKNVTDDNIDNNSYCSSDCNPGDITR
jgi:UDP-N-acetylmuramyl tripeptide synthase